MWTNGFQFEDEVRRIARSLWGAADGDGGAEIVDGRERDCIFETEDLVHYIECTRKRELQKVKDDADKMVRYREKAALSGRLVKLWIVTEHEPTPDQRTEAKRHKIEILSLTQFERKVLDADGYLELRRNYRFGSATDPDTDSDDISQTKYQKSVIRDEDRGAALSTSDLAKALARGEFAVLLGDYGMGKSITLREVFMELRKQRVKGEIRQTPVLLNLRDHWGQRSPSEALERHARDIGFKTPHQLVRALNAGKLIVMLDGFDETASIQWSPREGARMKEARQGAVLLSKRFADVQRGRGGFVVAGRDHFFDNRVELAMALGIKPGDRRWILDGFTTDEMKTYLISRGLTGDVPVWLPNRPLLLAYLSRANLLGDILSATNEAGPAEAWDRLLDRICTREAAIHEHLGADSIRQLLEELASVSRGTPTGMGPVGEIDIFSAFKKVTDSDADEVAKPLLMRLPGLSVRDHVDGGRSFLDDQMLEVLRAAALGKFVANPHVDPGARAWRHGLGPTGVEVVARRLRSNNARTAGGLFVVAAGAAAQKWAAPVLALDLVHAARSASSGPEVDFGGLVIIDASTPVLDLSDEPLPVGLTLQSADIGEFVAPSMKLIGFVLRDCLLDRVFGWRSAAMFPEWMVGCSGETFDDVATNAEVLRSVDIALGVRVALTILRKLYRQRGHGRKENGLSRGMDQKAQTLARAILPILRSEGLAFSTVAQSGTLWHPVQGQRRRANEMLDNPSGSEDPFLTRVDSL